MNQIDFSNNLHWADGRDVPLIVQTERDLRQRMKKHGFGLVADKSSFTDSRFQGGYMIVSRRKIIAGRNFDLSLPEVIVWVDEHCKDRAS